MTTVLAKKGQVVIPKAIRDELGLDAGDNFDVYLQDGEIVLRPLPKRRNQGLAAMLLSPPGALDLPKRSKDKLPPPLDLE